MKTFFDSAFSHFKPNDALKAPLVDNVPCEHKQVFDDKGSLVCLNCGNEIEKTVQKNIRDDIIVTKNIVKDLRTLGISGKVTQIANNLYVQTTKGRIYRGKSRKSIIFACVFHAYIKVGCPQTCDQLIRVFNLERKVALNGLKRLCMNAPKSCGIHGTSIHPRDLIEHILKSMRANEVDIRGAIELYKKIENRSSILNRSRPQSVAAGVVRYYMLRHEKNRSIKDFSRIVHLSELTINRMVKEIAKLLE